MFCRQHGKLGCGCGRFPEQLIKDAQQAETARQELTKLSSLTGRPAHPGGCYHCDHGKGTCICPGQAEQKKQAQQAETARQETAALLNEREKTHGSFAQNAALGQTLRTIFRNSPGWEKANQREREVLDYLAGKLSRILSGKPDAQHWEDIAGYATLAYHPDQQR